MDMSAGSFVVTSAACRVAGGKWLGGHDLSGHVFLLAHASAFLWAELEPVVRGGWSGVENVVVGATLAVWWWMLLMTGVYFHTAVEKVSLRRRCGCVRCADGDVVHGIGCGVGALGVGVWIFVEERARGAGYTGRAGVLRGGSADDGNVFYVLRSPLPVWALHLLYVLYSIILDSFLPSACSSSPLGARVPGYPV